MDFFKKAQELVKPAGDGASGDGGIAAFASSFVSSHSAPDAAPAPAAAPAGGAPPAPDADPSYKELFSSAQVVYSAASGKGGEKVDYGVLAGAGSDLLEGLAAHTKLDEGAFGSYLTQAEGYLDSYHKSHTAPREVAPPVDAPAPAPEAAAAPPPPAPEAAAAPPPAPEATAPPAPEAAHPPPQ